MQTTIIDMAHLEKYVGSDEALRDEILAIFVEQVRSMIDRFDIELSDTDWALTAHTLKGAARGVGAWSLGDLCEKAEGLVGNVSAKTESRASLLVSLRQLGNAVIEETQSYKLAASA